MVEKRTDLAIEARESFPEDDVEVKGVILKDKLIEKDRIRISTVNIVNENGARCMNKPIGNYVTIEFTDKSMYLDNDEQESFEEKVSDSICKILKDIVADNEKENSVTSRIGRKSGTKKHDYMVMGLGNRFATPDALGPAVIERIDVNRHMVREFGDEAAKGDSIVCAITPGVMAQTGMDTSEILKGLVENIKPDIIFVVDALASRSIGRLCRTIQITDTGISPGAGIGNNRKKLNEETIHVPVIAIGVPTVVDAGTIVSECMEETLERQGFSESEIRIFIEGLKDDNVKNMFVTPKDIDEQIRWIGRIVSDGMNKFFAA